MLTTLLLASCGNPPATASLPASLTPVLRNPATPTITLTPEPTLTATLEPRLVQRCFSVEDKEIALKDVVSGTILINSDLIDSQTEKKYKLPSQSNDSSWGGSQASPNRNMFAYLELVENNQSDFIKEILWVVNARADVLAKVTFDRTDLYSLRWLDNQRLLFYVTQTESTGTVLVFNPFTREQRTFSNELPDLYKDFVGATMTWRVEYSPNLEWVVYFGDTKSPGLGPIVRDLVIKQTVWKPPVPGWSYERPAWSPDGKEVAVIASGHLYIVNHAGQSKPILDQSPSNLAAAPAWSPDGLHIAFWNGSKLMVYNKQMDQVVDVCVQNDVTTHSPPLWSLDSNQLAVEEYIDQGPGKASGFDALVDLQKNIVYKLPSLSGIPYPDAWMNSLP